jgi:hypothetical protein
MHISGQCHCGAISFTALVDPSKVIACHCTDCQVFSGAPYRAVLPTRSEDVRWTGTPQRYIKVAASGNRRTQAFCAQCGTQLYASDPDSPTVLNLRLGCVSERAQLPPVVHIWGQSALPWVPVPAGALFHTQGLNSALMGARPSISSEPGRD